jgi:hypothetical protein
MRVPLSFELHGGPQPGSTVARMTARDLSLGGLYCASPLNFPEMTRLGVRLYLPDREKPSDGDPPLELEAVVVRRRAIPSSTGGTRYELALFFTSLDEGVRNRLAGYLKSHSSA